MSDWFDEGSGGTVLDVVALLDGRAGQAVAALADAGALVSLGLSRDRGALSLTVTVDGRWKRTWVRSEDDLVDWASEALPHVRAAVDATNSASAEPRSRGRSRRGL